VLAEIGPLSVDSLNDLEAYFELFLRREKRRARRAESSGRNEEAAN
jgi:hypothetical protein